MKQTNTRLDGVKSQSSETMIRKTTKQFFFDEIEKTIQFLQANLLQKKKTLIPNNLTVMVTLIPFVEILRDPYKISITTKNTLR